MSIFLIVIIASIARLALSRSAPVVGSVSRLGVGGTLQPSTGPLSANRVGGLEIQSKDAEVQKDDWRNSGSP